MIEAIDLHKTFETSVALQGLSFTARPGDILGFLGPNGAGKSTTVKILTGMIRPTAGRALIGGRDVVADPLGAKRLVGYVPESAALYESLTAREYLELVAALHALAPGPAERRARALVEFFDLGRDAGRRLSEFSKGMRQKVLLAAALLHDPPVILLDEPLNGLDANAVLLVKELLRGLAARGRTIFFCSHLLDVVERMCTRVLVIAAGRAVVEGTAAEILATSGRASLDEAFQHLTGAPAAGRLAEELIAALEGA